jgi:hypothetical protein
MHTTNVACSEERLLASLVARLEALERKLERHEVQLRELQMMLLKLLVKRRRSFRFEDSLADQWSQLKRQLPRRSPVLPSCPPLHPKWS